jgi:hypothetical protein
VALASLVGLVLVGAAAAPSAGAAWTAPVTLSTAGQNALDPQVAVDANGNAVFAWRRFDGTNWRIQARTRSAAGVLGPVQNLSAAGQNATSSQVGVDSDGDAVFTWRRFDGTKLRIQSRARSAAGVLGPVQNLSAAGQSASPPKLGVDGTGRAVFTWHRSDGTYSRIQARARSAAGILSPVQNLSAAGQSAFDGQVAVSPQGKAVFTWERDSRVEARARSAAGALSPVQTVSPPRGPNYNAPLSNEVGVDAKGNAVLAWNFYAFGPPGSRGTWLVQARARSAAGALSPVKNIVSPPIGGGGCGCEFQVAVDPTGDAVFSWEYWDDYLDYPSVQVRARSAAGALSPIQDLTSRAGDFSGERPQVGMDGAGDAVITWDRDSGIGAQVRSAAGPLGPLQAFPGDYAGFPQVAVNGAGDAVVTWQNSNGTNTVIQAAAGP